MPAATTRPAAPTPPPTTADADDAYYRTALHEFIDCSTEIACHLRHRIVLNDDPGIIVPVVAAFDHIGRGLRRAILLARHTRAPVRAETATGPAVRRAEPAAPTPTRPDREHADRVDPLDRLPALPDRPIPELVPELVPELIDDLRRDIGRALAKSSARPIRNTDAPNTTAATPDPAHAIRVGRPDRIEADIARLQAAARQLLPIRDG